MRRGRVGELFFKKKTYFVDPIRSICGNKKIVKNALNEAKSRDIWKGRLKNRAIKKIKC
jgi:hypothetical protein